MEIPAAAVICSTKKDRIVIIRWLNVIKVTGSPGHPARRQRTAFEQKCEVRRVPGWILERLMVAGQSSKLTARDAAKISSKDWRDT